MFGKLLLKAVPLLFLGGVFAVSCVSDEEEWTPSKSDDQEKTDPETDPVSTVTYSEKAMSLYDAIKRYYSVTSGATSGLFNENYPKGSSDGAASYLWNYDGLVSGIANLNKLGYNVSYTTIVDNYTRYWRKSGHFSIEGFGSSTDGTNGGGDRFYDDNSIAGFNLVEAYRQTKKQEYLDRAAKVISFLKTGKDDKLGGGLWWNESLINVSGNDDSNKAGCSNSFAVWFLMDYYDVCPSSEKAEVLSLAKSLYSWVKSTLRDDDKVYMNSIGCDGRLNRTKWTYISGAMIADGVRLYKATADEQYLKDAEETADGAFSYFVKQRNGINRAYPTNDPWFTVKLIRGFIELEPYYKKCTDYISAFITFMDYGYEHGRMSNGLYYEDWTGVSPNADRDKSLLMQDAALESLTVIALYKNEKPNA